MADYKKIECNNVDEVSLIFEGLEFDGMRMIGEDCELRFCTPIRNRVKTLRITKDGRFIIQGFDTD